MEYAEYIESVVANASEMIATAEITKEELLKVLPDEYHGSILQIARETQNALIQDVFRLGLTPFMQPEEGEDGEEAEERREPR